MNDTEPTLVTFRDHATRLGRIIADDHSSEVGSWGRRIEIESERYPGQRLVMEVCVREQADLRVVWGYGALAGDNGEQNLIEVAPSAVRSEREMWQLVAWTGGQIAARLERP